MAGGAGMSCNELGMGGVDGVGGMSMRTQAALGNIHSRRWWTGCPSASCTSRVTRTRAASTAVSGSWARQRGGPDELLAVADLDAAFEVSFELLPVMGGPEPRAALQHQRRFRVSARGAPRAGSVQLPGTHRPRAAAARQVARAVRSGAEQARPSGERQRAAWLDALSTQALSAGRKLARRHRGDMDRYGPGPGRRCQ